MRVYLMPMTGAGTRQDPRRPKYRDTDFPAADWTQIDSGTEAVCLVAVDATPEIHAALVAHADVTAAPADLDQQVGSALTIVQNALEGFDIPATWVTGTMTYRTVVRYVAALFQFYQRYMALGGVSPFGTGVTLSTRINQLPAGVRQTLQQAATDLGYDTSALTGTSTLRSALRAMADAWRLTDTLNLGDNTL